MNPDVRCWHPNLVATLMAETEGKWLPRLPLQVPHLSKEWGAEHHCWCPSFGGSAVSLSFFPGNDSAWTDWMGQAVFTRRWVFGRCLQGPGLGRMVYEARLKELSVYRLVWYRRVGKGGRKAETPRSPEMDGSGGRGGPERKEPGLLTTEGTVVAPRSPCQ